MMVFFNVYNKKHIELKKVDSTFKLKYKKKKNLKNLVLLLME